jgi:outer membrane autotransporter protein
MALGALTRNPLLCRASAVLGIFIAVGCIGFAPAHADCTSVLIAGGLQVDCSATTAPDPSVSPAIPSGDNLVQIFSGTYNGAFTIAGGNNSVIVTGGQLNGNFVTGTGADQFTMQSGNITGNIDQGDGADTFTMSGGMVGSLQQGGGLDTFLMTGGTIVGAFTEGDFVTITGGTIGSVDMTIANNVFVMSGGVILGNVVAGFQNDTFTLSGGIIGGNVNLGNGTNILTVSGGQIGSGITTGTGVDTLTWSGGTIAGAINLGNGNDQATLANLTATNLAGTTVVNGGLGTDSLTFSNSVITGVGLFQNWETVELTNGTQWSLDGNLALGDAGTLTGTLSIDSTSVLRSGGLNASILAFTPGQMVTVTNAGTIDLTNGAPTVTDTLTVVGNYFGAGGFVNLNTVLSTDGSPSDRLIIDGGAATGSSLLRIMNAGGSGAQTVGNGILVVDTVNGGTTLPSSFGLAMPVAAGPFAYTLQRSSVDASNAEAWYLRSTIDCTLDPGSPACAAAATPAATAPNYRPETSLYAALPAMALLYGRTLLDTLHERTGVEGTRNTGQWGRVTVLHGNRDGDALGIFGSGPKYNYDFAAFQTGQDFYRARGPNGARTRAGAYVALGSGRGDVTHFDASSAGRNSMTAFSAGAYWTHFAASGWYLDGVLQGTWYDVKGASTYLPALETEGAGLAASIEGGLPVRVGGGWIVEPQVQAVFQNVDLHDGNDGAALIQFRDVQSLAGRVGLRLAHTWSPASSGDAGQVTVWLRPNLWHEFLGDPATSFSSATGSIPFRADLGGGWAELNVGMTAQITDAVSLFANASYQHGLDGDSRAYDGKLGFRIAW